MKSTQTILDRIMIDVRRELADAQQPTNHWRNWKSRSPTRGRPLVSVRAKTGFG